MRKFWIALFASLLLTAQTVHASEGKETGGAPYVRLKTFTVNLKGMTHYLQADISLKLADPKLADAIKSWDPVIRHELILLLSDQSDTDLATLAGKQRATAAIRAAINKILKLDEKTGVTDVLFESFVIQ